MDFEAAWQKWRWDYKCFVFDNFSRSNWGVFKSLVELPDSGAEWLQIIKDKLRRDLNDSQEEAQVEDQDPSEDGISLEEVYREKIERNQAMNKVLDQATHEWKVKAVERVRRDPKPALSPGSECNVFHAIEVALALRKHLKMIKKTYRQYLTYVDEVDEYGEAMRLRHAQVREELDALLDRRVALSQYYY